MCSSLVTCERSVCVHLFLLGLFSVTVGLQCYINFRCLLCLFQQRYQNFQLLGAWCLLNSLFLILNLSPTALADKGKEKDPLAALRVRDILSRTKEGVGSPKLGPGKGYVSLCLPPLLCPLPASFCRWGLASLFSSPHQ